MVFIYLANLRDVQTVLGQEIADAVIRALAGRLEAMADQFTAKERAALQALFHLAGAAVGAVR